jgi:glycosyltransferase involved in cell wall biosynthesis
VRIGLIIDTFGFGGAENMVFEIAKLLKNDGHAPVLLHFGSSYITNFCNEGNIEHHLIPNRRFYKKTVLLPLFALKTRSFVKKLKLDCLHAHLFGPIVAFAPLAWLSQLAFVGTLHDEYMVKDAAHRVSLLKLALMFNAKLVTVSNPMKAFYVKTLNCESKKITYVPNCTQFNANLENKQAIRESLGIRVDDIVVLTVGRLVRLKRFDIFIDGIAKLIDKSIVKAYIVGSGPEHENLQQQITTLGLASTITMLGERNDVENLLAAADIFTLTSETEGMSKSILEALAANLPVIATNVGGNRDLVIHDKNGFLIEDHAPHSLTRRLQTLLEDEALRKKMGACSSKLIQTEYNQDMFLNRHLAIYKQTIESLQT